MGKLVANYATLIIQAPGRQDCGKIRVLVFNVMEHHDSWRNQAQSSNKVTGCLVVHEEEEDKQVDE